MPISDAAAAIFYECLFELDPNVRALFKSDMSEQKKKLMQTLTVAVDGLSNLERLVPVLKSLGVRHAGYMVADHHYDLVGEALLFTLREGLGDGFTQDVETAWTEVYGLIADVMKKAAAEHGHVAASGPENVPPLPFAPASMRREAAPAASPREKPRGVVAPSPTRPPEILIAPDSLGGRTLVGVSGPDDAPAPARLIPAPAPAPAPAQEGPVSPRAIALVQRSWAKVMPISDAAATLFYDRLFELDPSVRALFKNELAEQKKKLMQTLTVAVDGLNNLPRLLPVLKDLGVRHAGYMVAEHHYDLVGEALLWTLREGLGDEFTSEVETAWGEVYGLVAGVMKAAAAEHTGSAESAFSPPTPQAPAATPLRQSSRAPNEDDLDTLHYDSSRAPPVIPEASATAKPSPARRPEPAPRPAPVQESLSRTRSSVPPPAPVPVVAASPQQTASIVMPLTGAEVTLNVRLTVDGPIQTAPREAPLPETGTSGGLTPALLLATLCAISSMALATLAPGLGPNFIPQFDVISPLAVPTLVLVLVLAAFGLGYLWGRGRRPASAGAVKPKS
jgi:hemoglobin-like flavoprotein